MEITDIMLTGNDAFLRHAIKSGASLRNLIEMSPAIEMEAHLTLADVNLYELSMLAHVHRDRIRIISEEPAGVPTETNGVNKLKDMYPGVFEDPEGKQIPSWRLVEQAMDGFMNISIQMVADYDIVESDCSRLFIPMGARHFTVQIPFPLTQLLSALKGTKLQGLFSDLNYSDRLKEIIDSMDVTVQLLMAIDVTMRHQYSERDKYTEAYVLPQLKRTESKNLYDFNLIGFNQYDPIQKFNYHVMFFEGNKDAIDQTMKIMKVLRTPLFCDFVVELPVETLTHLERTFSNEDLQVLYRSDPNAIIENGFKFNNFYTIKAGDMITGDPEEPEEPDWVAAEEERENEIAAYIERITLANQAALQTVSLLTSDGPTYEPSAMIGVLPSVYMAKVVLRLDYTKSSLYTGLSDNTTKPLLKDLCKMMSSVANGIKESGLSGTN